MRGLTSQLASDYQQTATTFATQIKITRKDGKVFAYTDHDQPIKIDADGAGVVTYRPEGTLNRSAVPTNSDMSVGSGSHDSYYLTGDITKQDLEAGLFDSARFILFQVNWQNLSHGIAKWTCGFLGQTTLKDFQYTIETRDLFQIFESQFLAVISASCRSPFAATGTGPKSGCRWQIDPPLWQPGQAVTQRPPHEDSYCNVVKPSVENGFEYVCVKTGVTSNVSPTQEPIWPTVLDATIVDGTATWKARRASKRSATVTAVSDRRVFTVDGILGDLTANTGGTLNGGWFAYGQASFIDGQNAGLSREIIGFTGPLSPSGYVVATFLPFPFDIAPGDHLKLLLRCDKVGKTCSQLRDNKNNFRGEDFTPGRDVLFGVFAASAGKK